MAEFDLTSSEKNPGYAIDLKVAIIASIPRLL